MEKNQVSQLISRFERAWQRGEAPDIGRLAEIGSFDPSTLIELIAVDLEFRWKTTSSGRGPLVETYLERFPQLVNETKLDELIGEEYRVRVRSGKQPTHTEYRKRFPSRAASMIEVLQRIDREMLSSCGDTDIDETRAQGTASGGDVDALTAGIDLGPYHLIRPLGSGAFGQVWLAERRGALATTEVALKLPLDNDQTRAFVRREAQTWVKSTGHPNVLPILDADIYQSRLVIASEYISSGSLADQLRLSSDGSLKLVEACEIVIGILSALEYLHGRGVVHQDLKPANVMMQQGIPRLADFGLARELASASEEGVGGTPAYMAPEAFEGHCNVATDLWSLAVMFYQMLTGRLPFSGRTIFQYKSAFERGLPPEMSTYMPEHWWSFLERALSFNPDRRFPSAAHMRAELSTILRSGPDVEAMEATSNSPASPPRYRAIAITGTMEADVDSVRTRLREVIDDYASTFTTWYLGTWGKTDFEAARMLLREKQRVMLVGYGPHDVSPEMRELIDKYDLTFVDPTGLVSEQTELDSSLLLAARDLYLTTLMLQRHDSGSHQPSLAARDLYLITKVDVVTLLWDGKSRGTQHILDAAMRFRKDLRISFVESSGT